MVAILGRAAILRPVLRRLACLLPLRFPKKDIYDRWIQKGIVEVPAMTATCRLSVPGMNTSEFSSSLELRCQKAGDAWSCAPKMYGTTALGIIGTQLENFVNTNTEIRRQIEKVWLVWVNEIRRQGWRMMMRGRHKIAMGPWGICANPLFSASVVAANRLPQFWNN